jgi:hypothetical protein
VVGVGRTNLVEEPLDRDARLCPTEMPRVQRNPTRGFSCKGRGLCPSCMGRRMAATAAKLIERVLPPSTPLPWRSTRRPARLVEPNQQGWLQGCLTHRTRLTHNGIQNV